MIDITDADRIRTITLNRPEAKNAMNEAMWDAAAAAFLDAATDPDVAVVVFTGTGDAFSAGQDVIEMAQRATGDAVAGEYGFAGMCEAVANFPKPLICAVNGLGLGFGVTILGFADLVFMADTARLKCPFTTLGVAPEFASSFTFPQLLGRQNASWVLMSSEWISADVALDMGLAFKVCPADDLMTTTMHHARILAAKPINSLMECKRVIMAPARDHVAEARRQEDAAFAKLLGGPANIEAMTAFAEKRPADFSGIEGA